MVPGPGAMPSDLPIYRQASTPRVQRPMHLLRNVVAVSTCCMCWRLLTCTATRICCLAQGKREDVRQPVPATLCTLSPRPPRWVVQACGLQLVWMRNGCQGVRPCAVLPCPVCPRLCYYRQGVRTLLVLLSAALSEVPLHPPVRSIRPRRHLFHAAARYAAWPPPAVDHPHGHKGRAGTVPHLHHGGEGHHRGHRLCRHLQVLDVLRGSSSSAIS